MRPVRLNALEHAQLDVTARAQLLRALELPARQQPTWPEESRAVAAREKLGGMAPLVLPSEAIRLQDHLAAAARGEAFVLQGGNCAETFAGNVPSHVENIVNTLLHLSMVLSYGASLPVVKIGRLAGQYAKPRSSDLGADGLPSYRGDLVNSQEATQEARRPDPDRILRAHRNAMETLNLVRSLVSDGRAQLRNLQKWNEGFLGEAAGIRYGNTIEQIGRAVRFLESQDMHLTPADRSELFISHEALVLDYERAFLRAELDDPGTHGSRIFSGAAHSLWIGERTRQLDHAHIAFAQLISNPVGVKIGPTTTPEEAVEYANRLDPDFQPGRLTLIARMGWENVRTVLPGLVEKVTATGHEVVWQCDPMHGNTFTAPSGLKTRHFDHIAEELVGFFEVHRTLGTHPGGLHLELAGEDVTECLGGPEDLELSDLETDYRSACDPRLNRQQAVELAFLASEILRG